MKCIIVFLVLFECAVAQPTAPVNLVLNILKRRPRGFKVLRQNYYGIDALVYTADGIIAEVRDSNGNIWRSDKSIASTRVTTFKKDSRLLHIHSVTTSGKHLTHYFYRSGRVWNEVDSKYFYDEFDVARLESSAVGVHTLYLNDRNSHRRVIWNHADTRYGAYAPASGMRLDKVCDVNWGHMCVKSVWSRRKNEYLLFSSVYPRDKPTLVYLVLSDGFEITEQYYEKIGVIGRWTQIEREKFVSKVFDHVDLTSLDLDVGVDFENVNKEKVYTSSFGIERTVHIAYPRPGTTISAVTVGELIIWKSTSFDKCDYACLITAPEVPLLAYLLLTDGLDRRIEYFLNQNKLWIPIEKSTFYQHLTQLNCNTNNSVDDNVNPGDNVNPVNNDMHLEMSSFRNRRGLLIRTYRSCVKDSRGTIVLTHGIGLHFIEVAMRANLDWNYANFGFITHPFLICPDTYYYNFRRHNGDRFRHIFEYNFDSPLLPTGLLRNFEYSGGLMQLFNQLGYDVYGMDLQSNGFSESYDSLKSHVCGSKDYLDDMVQFLHIVLENKFKDPAEWTANPTFNRGKNPVILFGFSFGANLSIRTIQELVKRNTSIDKTGGNERMGDTLRIVDGVVSLSGMLNMESHLGTRFKTLMATFIRICAALIPRKIIKFKPLPVFNQSYPYSILLNVHKY
eukprot:XP_766706.1 hypothetical protein [Theileria parva strain Muguga]